MRTVSALGLASASVACGGPAPTSSASEPVVSTPPSLVAGQPELVGHSHVLVITGTDANHSAVTEPLVETIPVAAPGDVVVDVAFDAAGPPIMLGIEGAIGFVKAHAPDGSVALDRIVDLAGGTVTVPPGDYLVEVYYRSCDGNCGLLDPPHQFCIVEFMPQAGEHYALTVSIRDRDNAVCAFS